MNRNSSIILLTLLLCHSPLKWLTGVALLLASPLLIKKGKLLNFEKNIIIGFTAIILIGSTLNIAHNQNAWGIIFGILLLSPNILLALIFSKRANHEDTYKAVKIFTIIQAIIVSLQYTLVALKTNSINIFSIDQSSGDLLAGTFISFSTPLAVTFSLITILFIWKYFNDGKKTDIYFSLVSICITLATGAMSILLISAPIIAGYTTLKILKSSITKSKKIYLVLLIALAVPLSATIQQNNVRYSNYMIERIANNDAPFKIELMQKTFIDNFSNFILGIGIGNFSSRASLFLSGQYLGEQLFVPVSASQESIQLILPYFNVHIRGSLLNGFDALSIVSEPFSQYTTLFSEYGLIGLSLFLLLFGYIFFEKKSSLETKTIIALSMVFFLLNSWLEYQSYSCMMILLVYLFRANQSEHRAP